MAENLMAVDGQHILMKTIREETYSLPLHDTPLQYTGLASDYTTSENIPQEDETRGTSNQSITIRRSEIENGYDRVEAIHQQEQETIGNYYFKVVNPDHQVCVYTGDDPAKVPWPVRRALERFGLHDRTSPNTPRKYVFDHLISGARSLGEIDYETPVLKAWLNHLAGGVANYAMFVAFETQLPEDDFQELLDAFVENLDEMLWWKPDIDDRVSKYIYDNTDLDTPVYLPREDNYIWTDSESEENETSEDNLTTYVEVSTTDTPDKYVFAAHLSRYAIDRYRFAGTGENTLVLEHDSDPDLPPYSIIRLLQNEGYHIENIPTLDPQAHVIDRIEQTDKLIQWVRKRYETESAETSAAYSRYIMQLEAPLILAVLHEVNTSMYQRNRDSVFEDLGISPEDINPDNIPYDLLQQLTAALMRKFDEDTFASAEEKIEEVQLRERIDEHKEEAAKFEEVPDNSFEHL